jgi:mannose-6-phosphate isomerase-like protein (cupin superfamily)
MATTTRRVVLGVGPDGRSCVTDDGPAPVHDNGSGSFVTEIWSDDRMPPTVDGAIPDPLGVTLELPPGATRFWIAEFPPDPLGQPFMHRTDSLDYLIVLSGRVRLFLEDGDVELGPGDAVVQRAEIHGWRNDGDEPCRAALVMVSTSST